MLVMITKMGHVVRLRSSFLFYNELKREMMTLIVSATISLSKNNSFVPITPKLVEVDFKTTETEIRGIIHPPIASIG